MPRAIFERGILCFMAKKIMSKQLKKLLNIDEKELEPYFKYYLDEIGYEQLTPTQQEKLERYRKIWSWYTMGRTKQSIISAITKDYEVQIRQAEYDLAASIQLHGPLNKVDQDGRRNASIEFHDMLAQLSLKDKNFEVALKARKEADTLAGVYKDEDIGWKPEDFEKPTKQVWNIVQINNNYSTNNEQEGAVIELDE